MSELFTNISPFTFVNALGNRNSCALERGKISKIEVYDKANKIKRTTKYTYSQDPNRYNNYIVGVNVVEPPHDLVLQLQFDYNIKPFGLSLINSYYTYIFPVHLEKEETTDFFEGNGITYTTEYKYNKERLREQVVVYDSKNGYNKTTYKYPADFKTDEPYKSMISRHNYSSLVQTDLYKNSSLQKTESIDYGIFNNLYLPSKKRIKIGTSPEQTPMVYHKYDLYGNPINISNEIGGNITFIWSYGGQYPIAEIKNATYTEVETAAKSAFGVTSINDISRLNISDSNTLMTKLKLLREHSSLKNALVSTYTYKPLVGMLTATDPRGITTYYNYEKFGRLMNIKDSENKRISEYIYQYKNGIPSESEPIKIDPPIEDHVKFINNSTVIDNSGEITAEIYLPTPMTITFNLQIVNGQIDTQVSVGYNSVFYQIGNNQFNLSLNGKGSKNEEKNITLPAGYTNIKISITPLYPQTLDCSGCLTIKRIDGEEVTSFNNKLWAFKFAPKSLTPEPGSFTEQ